MKHTPQEAPAYVPGASIYAVQGASGEVIEGGITPDTQLSVFGTGYSDVLTVLYDGPLVVGVLSSSSGYWQQDFPFLPGPHKLCARTIDGYPSSAWIFSVQPPQAPQLIKLASRAGNVTNGGSTDQAELTLHGMTYPGNSLEVFADDIPHGSVVANDKGFWQKTLTGFTAGLHRLHAQTTDALVSDDWWVTIRAASEKPSITRVVDSSGDIIEGGSTSETALTLRGTGQPDLLVDIFDGYLLADSSTIDKNVFWLKTLSELKPVTHRLRARTQGTLWSATRTVHVLPSALKPVITRMQDINGEVGNGGTTTEPAITLTGVAEPGATVQIYDGEVFKTTVATAISSFWKVPLSGLTVGSHRFTARTPAGVSTEAWVVVVIAQRRSNPIIAARPTAP